MNRGSKQWLKHFTIGFTLMCAGTALAMIRAPALQIQIVFAGSIIYIVLVVLGLMARVGPFAYIGKLYIKDSGIVERPRENRWPDA
jgi:Ca2+/Na+ antiporter